MPNDGIPAGGTGTPAPVIAPVVAPVIAPAAVPVAAAPALPVVAPTAATPPELDPKWLDSRLSRAKEAGASDALKQLGVTDIATAKAAIEAAKVAEESKKSAEQRALEASNKATTAEQAVSRAQSVIREQAARMLMVLTPEQQKSVTDFAGDDPEQQLRYIQHAAPLWTKAAAPTEVAAPAAPGVPAPAAPTAAPVNTAPPPGAPPGTAPGSPPDHRAVYTQLQRTNPFAAAAYGLNNFGAVHIPKQ